MSTPVYYKRIVESPIYIKRRRWNGDGRGRLIECLRNDDADFCADFGQAYVTTVRSGCIKAWHLHKYQTDRMILLRGNVFFGGVLEDKVVLSLAVSDIDPYMIRIPPNVYHGFYNIGSEEAYILNIPDRPYDRESPDEERVYPGRFPNLIDWKNITMDG